MINIQKKSPLFDLSKNSQIKPKIERSFRNDYSPLPQIKKIKEIKNKEDSSDEYSSQELNSEPTIPNLFKSNETNINKEEYLALEKLNENNQKSSNIKKAENILETLNMRKSEVIKILNDNNINCLKDPSLFRKAENINSKSQKHLMNNIAKEGRNLYFNRLANKKAKVNKKSFTQETVPLLNEKGFNNLVTKNMTNISNLLKFDSNKSKKFEVISKYINNLSLNNLIELSKIMLQNITPHPKLNLLKLNEKFEINSHCDSVNSKQYQSVKHLKSGNESSNTYSTLEKVKKSKNEIKRINNINKGKSEINNIIKSQSRIRKSINIQTILTNETRKFRIENVENIHHKSHQINFIINLINTFLNLTFKNKNSEYKIEKILKLAKLLSINLEKSNINSTFFQSKDDSYLIKEHLLKLLYLTLNKENNLTQNISPKHSIFNKIFVAEGNNSFLVKSMIKQRYIK